MESKFDIGVAGMGDAEAIARFQVAMARESEGTELDPATVGKGVRAGIASGQATYIVARDASGEPVGSLMLTTEWSDWHNCQYYWIQSVYVRPGSRRRGAFRAMFAYAREAARRAGAAALRLYVDRDNSAAMETYRSLGMRESHYLMYEL